MTDISHNSPHIPQHVAIIMDGNGRWAKQKGRLRSFGHKAGVEGVRAAVRFCRQKDIKALTLFAFSSENWQRPEDEVSALMDLFVWALGNEAKKLSKNDVKLKVVGDLSRFAPKLRKKIAEAEALTEQNTGLILNIAANYGGKWDICSAVRRVAQDVQRGNLDPAEITEQMLSDNIQLAQLPAVDLLIRTGGEQRISNFLIWQLAYSELYFTPVLWPDFDEAQFDLAVVEYANRQRRFGLTPEQVECE